MKKQNNRQNKTYSLKGIIPYAVGKGTLFSVIAAGMLLSRVTAAWAVKSEVYENEYVITRKAGIVKSSVEAEVNLVKRSGTVELIRYPQEIMVVPRKLRRIVAYDRDQNRCEEVMKADSSIESCDPNFIRRALAVPNDQYFASQWGLNSSGDVDIDAPEAWELSKGRQTTVVAVIDSGIDYRHPDLAPNVWINPNEIAGNGIDDDGNGIIDDIHGYNAITGSGDPLDDNKHGTHVAGIIGARGDNEIGVTGVNWKIQILAAKILGADGSGDLFSEIRAIDYLVDLKQNHEINIIAANASYGSPEYEEASFRAADRLREAGILLVAAAGNSSSDNDQLPMYPANYNIDNVVSVAAIDRGGNLAWFSNYGSGSVDIAAPGDDITSTVPGGFYGGMYGTSMAAPYVTGALGLLHSYNPRLGSRDLKRKLLDNGKDYPGLQGIIRTGKVVNVGNMLSVSGTREDVELHPDPDIEPDPPTLPPRPDLEMPEIPGPTVHPSPDPLPPFREVRFNVHVGGGISGRKKVLRAGKMIGIDVARDGGTRADHAYLGLNVQGQICPFMAELSIGIEPLPLRNRIRRISSPVDLIYFTVNENGEVTGADKIRIRPARRSRRFHRARQRKTDISMICRKFQKTLKIR